MKNLVVNSVNKSKDKANKQQLNVSNLKILIKCNNDSNPLYLFIVVTFLTNL